MGGYLLDYFLAGAVTSWTWQPQHFGFCIDLFGQSQVNRLLDVEFYITNRYEYDMNLLI